MLSTAIDPAAVSAAAELLRGMGARRVFIFGSAVRGGLRPDSDVDMAVEGLPPQSYFAAVSRATELIGRPVDLVDLDDDTPIVSYLRRSGELVCVESSPGASGGYVPPAYEQTRHAFGQFLGFLDSGGER